LGYRNRLGADSWSRLLLSRAVGQGLSRSFPEQMAVITGEMIAALISDVVGNLLHGVAGQKLPLVPMMQSVLHLLQPDLFTTALTDG